MKKSRQTLAVAAAFLLTCQLARAAEPYDIHVVLPLTGSAAFVGQGEKDALAALESYLDKNGGVSMEDVLADLGVTLAEFERMTSVSGLRNCSRSLDFTF